MLKKIMSGGQTGVDRAGLEVAWPENRQRLVQIRRPEGVGGTAQRNESGKQEKDHHPITQQPRQGGLENRFFIHR